MSNEFDYLYKECFVASEDLFTKCKDQTWIQSTLSSQTVDTLDLNFILHVMLIKKNPSAEDLLRGWIAKYNEE